MDTQTPADTPALFGSSQHALLHSFLHLFRNKLALLLCLLARFHPLILTLICLFNSAFSLI